MRALPVATVLSLIAVLAPLPALAADSSGAMAPAAAPKAAAEIDADVQALAAPPPDVEILFEPLVDERYKLLSAAFELDGDKLPFDPKAPQTALFHGKLDAGPHLLDVKVVYNEAQGSGVFQYADYKLTVTSSVKIDAQKGLRSHVHLVVEKHPGAPQKQRLTIGLHVDSEMLAAIDDSDVLLHHPKAAPSTVPAVMAVADKAPNKTPDETSTATLSPERAPVHKARHRLTAGEGLVPMAAMPSPAPAPSDAGTAETPDAGPAVVVAAPPPLPAPEPVVPPADDSSRRTLGFALFGAGLALALLAWFLARRKKR